MSGFDRSDWEEFTERKGAEAATHQRPQLELVAQQAVKASLLTGDPNWDMLTTMVQGVIEIAQQQANAFQAALNDPEIVNHEALLLAKMSLRETLARIEAWEAVLQLPAGIMRDGAKAAEKLEKFGESDAAEDSAA